tara:strand:- start:1707 stop:2117 length:411 start_codon:yes stop_codon:yes gene_type:complete
MSEQTTFEIGSEVTVTKVSDELGLVFGYAIVCKVNGEDHFDTQGDHIPEIAMLKASLDFMKSARDAKEMHDGATTGTVLYAFPMTEDIAKSLGISIEKSGLLIGMDPGPAALEKFRDGTYTGFSIGGSYITNEAAA